MALSEETQAALDEAEELKARFCILIPSVSPTEYDEMTPHQVNIWIKVFKDIQKKSK
jgi:hypothetical protein